MIGQGDIVRVRHNVSAVMASYYVFEVEKVIVGHGKVTHVKAVAGSTLKVTDMSGILTWTPRKVDRELWRLDDCTKCTEMDPLGEKIIDAYSKAIGV